MIENEIELSKEALEIQKMFKSLEILCLITVIVQTFSSAIILLNIFAVGMDQIALIFSGIIEVILVMQIFKAHKGLKTQKEVRRVIYFFIGGFNLLTLVAHGIVIVPAILFVLALILAAGSTALKGKLLRQAHLENLEKREEDNELNSDNEEEYELDNELNNDNEVGESDNEEF